MESRATRGAVAAVVRRRRFAGGDVDHPSLVVEQTLSRRVITVVAALVATVALAHMAVVESAEGDGQCALTQNCHSYVLDSPCHAIPSDKKPTKVCASMHERAVSVPAPSPRHCTLHRGRR